MLYIFQLFHLTPPSQIVCVSLAGLSTGQKMARVLCVAVHFYAGPPQREKRRSSQHHPSVFLCVFVSPEEIINTRRRARI